MKNLKVKLVALLVTITFASCNKDDATAPFPLPINEEEVITTVTAVYTPQGGGTAITLRSRDLDGDGPNAPVVTVSGAFALNKTYDGLVTILNETKNPASDITTEVKEEAADHQLFYQKTGNLPNVTYSSIVNNFDANGKPLGLQSVFTTTTAATGILKITLRHLPNKSAAGVSGGEITNAGGATDFEVIFNGISVQ